MIAYTPHLGQVRLAKGMSQAVVGPAPVVVQGPPSSPSLDPFMWPGIAVGALEGVVLLGSIAASAYHGYKRNNSTGWAVWWGFMGLLFPIVTPAVAIAQGFGKRSK